MRASTPIAVTALALLLAAACVTYTPRAYFNTSFGLPIYVGGSARQIERVIARVAGKLKVALSERPGADTEYQTAPIKSPRERRARREARVSYLIQVDDAGKNEYVVVITCAVETKGIYEDKWQLEEGQAGFADDRCLSEFFNAIASAFSELKSK
jgi:hypothetical protein